MGLRDVTRAIIAQVERASGYPVLVTEDRSLQTLAAVRVARGSAPAHSITYNPSVTTQPDYLIAFQCGFILRLFANPPSERCDFAPAAHGREIVHRLLSGPEGPARKLRLQPDVVEKLRDQLFDGLMVQLRSIPSASGSTRGSSATIRNLLRCSGALPCASCKTAKPRSLLTSARSLPPRFTRPASP